jgi:hypothetical protein
LFGSNVILILSIINFIILWKDPKGLSLRHQQDLQTKDRNLQHQVVPKLLPNIIQLMMEWILENAKLLFLIQNSNWLSKTLLKTDREYYHVLNFINYYLKVGSLQDVLNIIMLLVYTVLTNIKYYVSIVYITLWNIKHIK